MSYKLMITSGEDPNPQELSASVKVSDTTVTWKEGSAEVDGLAVNVDRDMRLPIGVSLTTDVGNGELHDLREHAEFTLVVTEKYLVNENGKPTPKDVRETRYTRLTPVSFVRSHETGRVILVCKTYDEPEDKDLRK